MTRRRSTYHPPADPKEAKRLGDVPHFETAEDIDAFFLCRHGVDTCAGQTCLECDEELRERKAIIEMDLWREGLL